MNIERLLKSKRVEITFANICMNGNFVKDFREKHGITEATLANIIGVSKKTVQRWERQQGDIQGSSAILLKLLHDNPELIKQLYSVNQC